MRFLLESAEPELVDASTFITLPLLLLLMALGVLLLMADPATESLLPETVSENNRIFFFLQTYLRPFTNLVVEAQRAE